MDIDTLMKKLDSVIGDTVDIIEDTASGLTDTAADIAQRGLIKAEFIRQMGEAITEVKMEFGKLMLRYPEQAEFYAVELAKIVANMYKAQAENLVDIDINMDDIVDKAKDKFSSIIDTLFGS